MPAISHHSRLIAEDLDAESSHHAPAPFSSGFLDGRPANEDMSANNGVDISASQKMLSAVSGSLLTSLLGGSRHSPQQMPVPANMEPILVTPLDVVRVRLQSQAQTSKPAFKPSSLPAKLPFANLPPNLGVTQCCREVFWVNNSSSYCLANASPTATYTAVNPAISNPTSSTLAADCAADDVRQKSFTSTFDGLRKIARNEGLTSLWRGLSPTLVMAIPANVIYFTGYDTLRWNPASPIQGNVPDAYAPLLAGSIARVAAAATISPIEMLKTRMQAASAHERGVFTETIAGMKGLVQTQGITSLWRGLTLTMWRDVPFSGIYWWGYETMREVLRDLHERRGESYHRDHEHAPTFIDSFISGAVSGAFASVITTPFDVGKTRQQVYAHAAGTEPSGQTERSAAALRPEQRSMPRFLFHIWKEEGMSGLFRGGAPRMLKVAPACAIMISSYEVGKKAARRMNQRAEAEAVGG